MNQSDDIKILNNALKGEHMAILGYDHYIQHLQDPNIKSKFQELQETHQYHAQKLAKAIQDANGNPVNTAGLAGWVQEIKYRFLPKSQDTGEIIGNALEGEQLGIKMLEELTKKVSSVYKDLMQTITNESKRLVRILYDMQKPNTQS